MLLQPKLQESEEQFTASAAPHFIPVMSTVYYALCHSYSHVGHLKAMHEIKSESAVEKFWEGSRSWRPRWSEGQKWDHFQWI